MYHLYRKLYWLDEGGTGVIAKLAKANMDGTESEILLRDLVKPTALTIDLDRRMLYFSSDSMVKTFSVDWIF